MKKRWKIYLLRVVWIKAVLLGWYNRRICRDSRDTVNRSDFPAFRVVPKTEACLLLMIHSQLCALPPEWGCCGFLRKSEGGRCARLRCVPSVCLDDPACVVEGPTSTSWTSHTHVHFTYLLNILLTLDYLFSHFSLFSLFLLLLKVSADVSFDCVCFFTLFGSLEKRQISRQIVLLL